MAPRSSSTSLYYVAPRNATVALLLLLLLLSLLIGYCFGFTEFDSNSADVRLTQRKIEQISDVTITSYPPRLRHHHRADDASTSRKTEGAFLLKLLSSTNTLQPEVAGPLKDLTKSFSSLPDVLPSGMNNIHNSSSGESGSALTTVTPSSTSPRVRALSSDYDVSDGRLRHFRSLPDAIIIGVKKCGTRALLEFLRAHPDVRATGPETHFFDKFYDLGLDWYRNQMPISRVDQMTIEKTPSYFVTTDAPERIHRMSNSTRLVIVVRDPVTRAISHYTQVLTKKPTIPPFEHLAFSNTSSLSPRTSFWNTSSSARTSLVQSTINESWGAIQLGLYAGHLEKWLQFFPRDRIHFVSGERLIADPGEELEKVQKFLGLRRILTRRDFAFSSRKGFPCLRKSGYDGFGRQGLHCLGENKGRSHPLVDPEAITRLREFFRPHNRRFYRLTGIDFGWP